MPIKGKWIKAARRLPRLRPPPMVAPKHVPHPMTLSDDRPQILAVGGAHIDRRGQMTADFVPGASIPGAMREDVGGGAFNALRVATRRGARSVMMSVRGGDGSGATVADAIAVEGIADASVVFLDRATPSYTALLDRDGDVVAALADMGLYDLAFPKQMRRAKLREEIAKADAVLADANLPETALRKLAELVGAKPLFAIAISPAKAVRLTPVLGAFSCLFMNRREAGALVGAPAATDPNSLARELLERGLSRGVITAGSDAMTIFDESGIHRLLPPRPRRVADVTGAGDAIAGATMVALMRGAPFRHALREGMAAALLAIENPDAVPSLHSAEFEDAMALVSAAAEMA